jgi:hypothetical protein
MNNSKVLNEMKKLIIAAMLMAIPVLFYAQDRDIKKLYQKYEKVTGFTMETEDPEINIDMDGDFSSFLNRVDNLYILTFESEKGKVSDRDAFEDKLLKMCNKKGFSTIMDISGESGIKLLSRKNNNDETTDFLLITIGEEESMFFWAASD